MTIARRLALLLVIPLLAVSGLGVFVTNQFGKIERLSGFVADKQIGSLATLGEIARLFGEQRVYLRNYLVEKDQTGQERSNARLREDQVELNRLLARYGDSLISSDEDRRLFTDYGNLSREWSAEADRLSSVSAAGHRDKAIAQILTGRFTELGARANSTLKQWIEHNVRLSSEAGNTTLAAIDNARRNLLIAVGVVMLLSGTLGFLTFRSIVHPVRALQTSVESIAAGNYVHPVPFTNATDETGALALLY